MLFRVELYQYSNTYDDKLQMEKGYVNENRFLIGYLLGKLSFLLNLPWEVILLIYLITQVLILWSRFLVLLGHLLILWFTQDPAWSPHQWEQSYNLQSKLNLLNYNLLFWYTARTVFVPSIWSNFVESFVTDFFGIYSNSRASMGFLFTFLLNWLS